jgi:hypothetical protein
MQLSLVQAKLFLAIEHLEFTEHGQVSSVDGWVVVLPVAKHEWNHAFLLLDDVVRHAFNPLAEIPETRG